ncbi:unnamed protein product [Closterium sp. NIES-53]
MPPKSKKEGPVERPILGRFSSHLKIGIVGLPNVGKSTLFNTLTKLSIPAENFPFCTINPNEARVNVPDERFDWLCQLFKPKSEVSAFLEVNDIAGLVRGANEGEGLGNAFLSHIRAVDGIFHVCRAFDDADVIHVEDTVDPIRDLEIIHNELRLKDIEFMERAKEDYEKQLKRSNDKQLKIDHELCLRVLAHLNEGKDVRLGEWKAADIEVLNTFQLLSAKPVVYLVNLTEKDYQRKKNKWLAKIHGWVQEHGQDPIIPFSGVLESKLADMPADEVATYCKENDIQSGLPKIIKTGFAAINLIYFFTAGPDEVRCWQIRKQTKAPQAAGAIHTDFEKGFICAEVMKFEDLKELGSESAVKAAGKYKQEGKMYVVQDGDIIFFKFNVSGGGKNKCVPSESWMPSTNNLVTTVSPPIMSASVADKHPPLDGEPVGVAHDVDKSFLPHSTQRSSNRPDYVVWLPPTSNATTLSCSCCVADAFLALIPAVGAAPLSLFSPALGFPPHFLPPPLFLPFPPAPPFRCSLPPIIQQQVKAGVTTGKAFFLCFIASLSIRSSACLKSDFDGRALTLSSPLVAAAPSIRRRAAVASAAPPAAAAAAVSAAAPAVAASLALDDDVDASSRRYPPFAAFRIHGTGRRKTAVARVGLIEGNGEIFVNGLPLNEYFQNQALMIQAVKLPLSSLGYEGKYDVVVKAHGGGLNAQAQAMVLGIARALVAASAANRPPLKAQGMLTRDARSVERKKYGLKKARKAPQFSKR